MRVSKKSLSILGVFLCLAFATILIFGERAGNMGQAIRILFPTGVLRQGIELLAPDNTETIWEYYLLENLSCGLVRDSKYSSTGYEGCIADRFYQENEKTWVFIIREIRWSDGSIITAREIENWIEDLRSTSKRHVRFLKLAEKVSFDEKSRQLRIQFPVAMDSIILHELSLADSGLVPVDFKKNGWAKTVGPYSVKEWDWSRGELKLIANKFSPFFTKEMPQEAVLEKLADPKQKVEVFRTIFFDVAALSSTSGPRIAKAMLQNAPQVWTSHPMSLDFFNFNIRNRDSQDIENRKEFASIVSEIRDMISDTTKDSLELRPETQMVPNGFNGRLDSVKPISKSKHKHLKKLKIELYSSYKEFDVLLNLMTSVFAKHGIQLEFVFTNNASPAFENNEFAGLCGFLGNQLDASGTWAFLASPPNGPLSPWIQEYQSTYDKIFHPNSIMERQNNLKLLHKEILEKVIAVPLMIGNQRYLLSEKVDASRWNQFDSRLRIYDLRWK